MKTEQTLEKSMRSRIRNVEGLALCIADCAGELQGGFSGKAMADLRNYAAELTQSVHEYNCYHNCLNTD